MDSNSGKKKNIMPQLPNLDEISTGTPAISEFCSVFRLPELFKTAKTDTLPVIDLEGKIVGIVSEYDVAKILPEWSFEPDSYTHDYKVYEIMTKNVWTETESTNIKDILSKVDKMHTRVIPIVDSNGGYVGNTVTRSSLVNYLAKFVKPRTLGGLATPLGVYITDGQHQAGAGNFGLLLTGIVLGGILLFVEALMNIGFYYFGVREIADDAVFLYIGLEIFLFIFLLRLTPLVKIHAAEHQTINAIERGMPLTVDIVKRQPREHSRCGTNLMVLILGVQVIIIAYASFFTEIDPLFQFLFLVTGFSFLFSNWKNMGMFVQKYLTTAEAENKYIESGIKAGEEILNKNKFEPKADSPPFWAKLWNTGIVQLITGFLLVQKVFEVFLNFYMVK